MNWAVAYIYAELCTYVGGFTLGYTNAFVGVKSYYICMQKAFRLRYFGSMSCVYLCLGLHVHLLHTTCHTISNVGKNMHINNVCHSSMIHISANKSTRHTANATLLVPQTLNAFRLEWVECWCGTHIVLATDTHTSKYSMCTYMYIRILL